ncbi:MULTISPECIES: TadE/TadG family type IV pilus assembly protein [unclassified Bradyrhizobium]|uniref:TadE/TadG family type IV pilus assembly protein n=1 Tax=Bradyrhizobium TaxID=374 RepID=UPI0028F105E3|nr:MULTISPECIES: Tad domain-containing protein [unclassified Bradyrhizobium]
MTASISSKTLRDLAWRFGRAKDGQISMIFAITIIPILVSVGAAVDFAKSSDTRAQLQKSVDAAVLAGVTQASAQQVSTASAVFSGSFRGRFGTGTTATFTPNSDGSLSGTATTSVKTSFLNVMGTTSLGVTASATAKAGAQTTSPVCILLVSTINAQSLLVNSGAQLNAPSCEIHVLSTQSPAAMFNATLNVKRICIKGTNITKNGGVTPPAETGCAAISDPFAGKLPAVTVGACTTNNKVYDPGSVTLNPGVYCGATNFNGSGTLTLNPGLYIIKGGAMTFNSGWTVTGSGVTFYLVDQNATLTFNGNVNATLSAPTSGTYANILMYEPSGLSTTNLPINGTSSSSYTGLMYLPSRNVTINSVSTMSSNSVTMVFNTLILNQTNWAIAPGALSMSAASGPAGTAFLSR